ncbi:S1 family peptidase [Vibrio sinaloensis]|uniref:S1 family peptidase n=1 Tax=Photobacterium sp. (strain ATCC 43367) TaxID=379097 RepID=UPI000694860B|nr:serine protease [Vibrio sinaloensis]
MLMHRLFMAVCLMCAFSANAIISGNVILQAEYDLDYPYLVSIRASLEAEKHYCGGTALSGRWVLTAAHCLVKSGATQETSDDNLENITNYEVALPIELSISHGAADLTDTDEVEIVRVTHVIIHPDYYPLSSDNTTAFQNDIALLYLETDLPITKFATLVDSNSYANLLDLEEVWDVDLRPSNLTLAGWGLSSIDSDTPDYELLETDAAFNPIQDCFVRVEAGREVPRYVSSSDDPTKLCSMPTISLSLPAEERKYGNGACVYDGGGPLIYGNIQVGVISASPVSNTICSSWTIPAWYTNINHYLDWISSYTDDSQPPTQAVTKPSFLTANTTPEPDDSPDDTNSPDEVESDTSANCSGTANVGVGGGTAQLGCDSSSSGGGGLGGLSMLALITLMVRRRISGCISAT